MRGIRTFVVTTYTEFAEIETGLKQIPSCILIVRYVEGLLL